MSNLINIEYINKSMNEDLPKIFIFMKNEIPTFDALKHGVAWKVIEEVGRESSCQFQFPIDTEVSATWENGSCSTQKLNSSIGRNYDVEKNNTGIVIVENGNAGNTRSIDVCNKVNVDNGIGVNLYKNNKIVIKKSVVAYGQKATFVLHPKLYWGVASEIQEGMDISSAVLNSDHFYELDLEGATDLKIGLFGNAKEGYQFKVLSQN